MLTRSSERIFNPSHYNGLNYFQGLVISYIRIFALQKSFELYSTFYKNTIFSLMHIKKTFACSPRMNCQIPPHIICLLSVRAYPF